MIVPWNNGDASGMILRVILFRNKTVQLTQELSAFKDRQDVATIETFNEVPPMERSPARSLNIVNKLQMPWNSSCLFRLIRTKNIWSEVLLIDGLEELHGVPRITEMVTGSRKFPGIVASVGGRKSNQFCF